MIPSPGVASASLDSADVVDDGLGVFMLMALSDGSLVGLCLPIAELYNSTRPNDCGGRGRAVVLRVPVLN